MLMVEFNAQISFNAQAVDTQGSRQVLSSEQAHLREHFSLKKVFSAKSAVPVFDKKGLLETSGLAVGAQRAISHRESTKYIQANKDLLYVVEQDDTLKQELSKTKLSKREDLVRLVAQRAHDLLSPKAAETITKKDLEKQSTLSSMIVLNTGGLRDFINKDSKVAAYFSQGAGEDLEKNVYKKLAEKVADLFPESHPLHDVEFLTNNPRAAIFLMEHKDAAGHFLLEPNGDLQAVEFKNEVHLEAYTSLFETDVNNLAADLTRLGGFNEDYFEDNDELATFVVASSYLQDSPDAAQYLRSMPQAALDNPVMRDSFNFDSFLKGLMTSQLSDHALGRAQFTEEVLQNNFGLAQLLKAEPEFRKNLAREKDQKDFAVLFGQKRTLPAVSEDIQNKVRAAFSPSFKDLSPAYSVIV